MEGCECIESAAARRRIPRLLAGPRHRLDRRHPRCLGWTGPAPIGPGTKAIEGGAGVNDVLDARIRELMADVVEQSPPPPQFPDQRVACLRRANRHPIGTGVAWAAALLALVATIWMLTANRPGPDVADPTAVTIEFTMISPALPERLRSEVLAIPGVADATYTITQPEPSGQGAVVTTSASEGVVTTVAPGIVVPSGRPHLTMTVALLPGADPLQVADGLIRVTGDRKSTRLNSSHGYISYA